MSYSGVIFDFNGTIFWDTKLHNKAWNIFLDQHDISFSDDEFFRLIHGRNNSDILKNLFGDSLSNIEIESFIQEKEMLYQDICRQADLQLAPGSVDFFDFLKSNDIPFTIATASGKENLDFYFENLPLSNWFDYDKVVYNNGKIKSKPDAEIYEIAMKEINRSPQDVMVFEDAIAGLQAAKNANAGKVTIVNSNNDNYAGWEDCQIITNFDQIDRIQFTV